MQAFFGTCAETRKSLILLVVHVWVHVAKYYFLSLVRYVPAGRVLITEVPSDSQFQNPELRYRDTGGACVIHCLQAMRKPPTGEHEKPLRSP